MGSIPSSTGLFFLNQVIATFQCLLYTDELGVGQHLTFYTFVLFPGIQHRLLSAAYH